MTKVLSIGLGGVGVIAAYTLVRNDPTIELTAVIRSDYDIVTTKGYSISSVDYGGRSLDAGDNDESKMIHGFKPTHVEKTLESASQHGPFDYIVICTKCVPYPKDNVWDQVSQNIDALTHPGRKTHVVLIQNGIDIDHYWNSLEDRVRLISGVSYILSVNYKGKIVQYGPDEVLFGYFDKDDDENGLQKWISMYLNDINQVGKDTNPRFTRWKKLLYNGSFNTICALTQANVGQLYRTNDENSVVEHTVIPIMKQIQQVANYDLEKLGMEERISDEQIRNMDKYTKESDAPTNYQPLMLVDVINNRAMELEVILGNVLSIHRSHGSPFQLKELEFLYYLLSLVQYRITRE
ncbi:uncharacterized protein KQ657_002342 [Scheffersomyces spartinae]|uniref:2-dehydropantoate 2-reductase n=1 Tax=Scheffersomyces spartinae TaxID=45513 RepID=A0A9P7VEV2_9ASCO|nr:uncharacterized protein KQ657_002342 [Scheffersomyces spartinae]KAG7195956.1 hypothetical protein KQ657_002342 [Scheffersomyces spartinae]